MLLGGDGDDCGDHDSGVPKNKNGERSRFISQDVMLGGWEEKKGEGTWLARWS